jgi:hypothetical protein
MSVMSERATLGDILPSRESAFLRAPFVATTSFTLHAIRPPVYLVVNHANYLPKSSIRSLTFLPASIAIIRVLAIGGREDHVEIYLGVNRILSACLRRALALVGVYKLHVWRT